MGEMQVNDGVRASAKPMGGAIEIADEITIRRYRPAGASLYGVIKNARKMPTRKGGKTRRDARSDGRRMFPASEGGRAVLPGGIIATRLRVRETQGNTPPPIGKNHMRGGGCYRTARDEHGDPKARRNLDQWRSSTPLSYTKTLPVDTRRPPSRMKVGFVG